MALATHVTNRYSDAKLTQLTNADDPTATSVDTDVLGYAIAENPVHVHDFNATLLHLMGINHERLTFRYQGRQFRLTDVEGKIVQEILS